MLWVLGLVGCAWIASAFVVTNTVQIVVLSVIGGTLIGMAITVAILTDSRIK